VRQRISLTMVAVAAAAAAAMAAATVYADSPLYTSRATLGMMTGQQIYEHICQGCHMPGGQGAIGAGSYPKLAGDKNFVSWQFVALTVLNGRNGMPPLGYPGGEAARNGAPHLSDAQIADVVNYVRGHFGNAYKPEVTAKQISLLPHPAAELMGPQ
jgi:mono/diheme cytochrome c family protein